MHISQGIMLFTRRVTLCNKKEPASTGSLLVPVCRRHFSESVTAKGIKDFKTCLWWECCVGRTSMGWEVEGGELSTACPCPCAHTLDRSLVGQK